jgi:hypothetical protein
MDSAGQVCDMKDSSNRIFEIAREVGVSSHVPYAFEKRIMARIGSARPLDIWDLWSRYLWQAAAPCVAVTLAVGIWAYFEPRPADTGPDLESALVAPLAAQTESW